MSVVRNDDDDDDKDSWVATLACSPGMGVGVLDCWGVCTKGFKHTNQLNPARRRHLDIKRILNTLTAGMESAKISSITA